MSGLSRQDLNSQMIKVEEALASLGVRISDVGEALQAIGREGDAVDLMVKWKAIVAKLADVTIAADEFLPD